MEPGPSLWIPLILRLLWAAYDECVVVRSISDQRVFMFVHNSTRCDCTFHNPIGEGAEYEVMDSGKYSTAKLIVLSAKKDMN